MSVAIINCGPGCKGATGERSVLASPRDCPTPWHLMLPDTHWPWAGLWCQGLHVSQRQATSHRKDGSAFLPRHVEGGNLAPRSFTLMPKFLLINMGLTDCF